MANYANLPAPTPEGGLNRYMQEIRKFPLLEPEEEYMLAKAWVEKEDTKAAHKMVTSHLRLVAKIAMGYRGYGLPVADLISEGNLGMMHAVKKFEPEKGFRLATYAMWWIKAAIQEYILRSWSLVKIGTTAGQKKLFFNLRKSKKRLGWLNMEEVNTVAHDLGVKPEVVMEMESRLSGQDVGFDLSSDSDDDDAPRVTPAAFLQSDSDTPEVALEMEDLESHQNSLLYEGLGQLDERSQDIIRSRWLTDQKSTLQELADHYGVSAERIRQLEVNAMNKMRASINA